MRSAISGTTVTKFSISETDHLQDVIDEISASIIVRDDTGHTDADNLNRFRGGADITLQKGTYDCDLVINNPGLNIHAEGGATNTEIMGKVTVYAPYTQMHGVTIRGDGKPYALRVMRNPAAGYQNVSRCRFSNMIVGGTFWRGSGPGVPVDGPVNGIEIDGVYLTDFHHVTSAFCSGNGWLVDSTNALYPSTTLGFVDCSAVKNGTWGYNFQQSCTGIHVVRGNVEQNGVNNPSIYAEMRIESVIGVHLDQVDFESDQLLLAAIHVVTSTGVMIETCNFTAPVGSAPLQWLTGQTVSGVVARNNRVENYAAGRTAQIDDRGVQNEIVNTFYAGPNAATNNVKVFSTGSPLLNCHR